MTLGINEGVQMKTDAIHEAIHKLKHYLPAQAPLKDFVHHNTLHAFQQQPFHTAIRYASELFGYKVSLSLDEYRKLYAANRISDAILDATIVRFKDEKNLANWKDQLLHSSYDTSLPTRVGALRNYWKKAYKLDIDSLVHPILFRIWCSYLDQGISIWNFPVNPRGFLASLKELEKNSYASIFRKKRARQLLFGDNLSVSALLKILIGDETLFERYIFDQQFAHQGWSGIIASIEDNPNSLISKRRISLEEVIIFELLLEIDALDSQFGSSWKPLSTFVQEKPADLFAPLPAREINEVLTIWQEAFEWTYYDQVLAGIVMPKKHIPYTPAKTFQAMLCIDDRECSFRRYLEKFDPECETFATPGYFGVEFYYQPANSLSYTKLCPAPVTPRYLIKELDSKKKRKKDIHFRRDTHSLVKGWFIAQTLGFWTAVELFYNIFRPRQTASMASSFSHMDKSAALTIEHKPHHKTEHRLQVGFTIDEMVVRVEAVLKSTGLVENFAPIVYMIGHGSSTVNNPHYAAYDCGACCGRPGSVNARVFSYMANHPQVREQLRAKGIYIPEATQFIGALHDTTRDEIEFFDEDILNENNIRVHIKSQAAFLKALDYNSKERSRRFFSINSQLSPEEIHKKIRERSVSIFEPRPELNHATNALCIVGRREVTRRLFLDRRSFMNSYDYRLDPDGKYLFAILKAAAPVCGGINLEYYFSRVDNQKLGAGTKLPHNVMGLFGVANGADGDLRPGLPSQMIDIHDPVRLLIVVEHFPSVLLSTIQQSADTYEWFDKEWVHLVSINPDTKEISVFRNGGFTAYQTCTKEVDSIDDITDILEHHEENLPVYSI